VVVYSDDWTLSNSHYSASSRALAENICHWLTGCGATQRILFDAAYSRFLSYSQLDADLAAAGFVIDRLPTSIWTPALLEQYDAVLMQEDPISPVMLHDYQQAGGNLLVIGGGTFTPTLFNDLLAFYNMRFEPLVNSPEVTTTFVSHPVTTGVTVLTAGRPSPITVLGAGPVVLSHHGGINWLALGGATGDCPPTATAPSTWGRVKAIYR